MGILMETIEADLVTSGYRKPEVFTMGAPREYYADALRTIGTHTRETEYESIVEPIPITLKTYKQYHMHGNAGYFPPQQIPPTFVTSPRVSVATEVVTPPMSVCVTGPSPAKLEMKESATLTQPPPKKKWIKEYLEEPKSPVAVRAVTTLPVVAPRSNGVVVRAVSPPAPPALTIATETLLDFTEHSRPRTTSISHGLPQIPSPPSVGSNGSNSGSGSNGSTPRAGTREVHNKLEKNRRAHLKECFEMLKRQLPASPDDKKTSNLSILASAIRYIQVLRRKERECEHEMERLAREKISAQQRLAAVKREVAALATGPVRIDTTSASEEKTREDRVNGQVLGIPISITSSSSVCMEASPPRSLNLSTKLRTLPIQITPTTSQVVRSSYGARQNTLTLTTLAPADLPTTQNGQMESGPTLVHPAQIHLPLSQVVSSGGLVVGSALQLLSSPAALRVLHAPHLNGVNSSENNRIPRENGITATTSSTEGVLVNGLSPLLVAPSAPRLLHPHTMPHKMVETQMVKGSVTPLTVSAQYLSATTIVKPVVVVSTNGTPPTTRDHS